MESVKVWDFPTRLFHWLIVILLAVAWITIENRWMTAHEVCGYLLLALIIFRVTWGFFGSTTSKFSNFICKPSTTVRYLNASLKSESKHYSGHNPAGGYMVILLITLLLFQTISGLYSNNDLGFTGPLADAVSKEWSDLSTKLHAWSFNVILTAVWLHIVAVFFYVLVKKDNLVKAMFTGRKNKKHAGKYQQLKFNNSTNALILLIISSCLVLFIVY